MTKIDQPTLIALCPPGKTGWPWTEASPPLPPTLPDGSPWPKISIVTPSFNQAQYLEETIRSVLLQGYPNLEYIIIDGGSTDGSVEIIKKYEPWLAYWVSENDRGQSHAINKGFEKCTGEIMNWLNSDDYLLPEALYSIGIAYEQIPDSVVIAGSAEVVDEYGELIRKMEIKPSEGWFKEISYPYSGGEQASWFFSRTGFNSIGKLNENLIFAMDIDFYLRLSLKGKISITLKPIAAFREHKLGKTSKYKLESIKEKGLVYKNHIKNLPLDTKEKKKLGALANKHISGMYLSSIDSHSPWWIYLVSVQLYPQRIFSSFFWKKLLFRY